MKMIHLILVVLIGCVANVTWAAEATAASFRAVASGRNDVVYLAPAYYEAMPIGNGRIGADSDGNSTFKGMIDSVVIYRSVKKP